MQPPHQFMFIGSFIWHGRARVTSEAALAHRRDSLTYFPILLFASYLPFQPLISWAFVGVRRRLERRGPADRQTAFSTAVTGPFVSTGNIASVRRKSETHSSWRPLNIPAVFRTPLLPQLAAKDVLCQKDPARFMRESRETCQFWRRTDCTPW